MSRLYCWIESDTRKTMLTTRANKSLILTVNYGSKNNSKCAVNVIVQYPKDAKKPRVLIDNKVSE